MAIKFVKKNGVTKYWYELSTDNLPRLASNGQDIVYGNDQTNILVGGNGTDTLYGGSGNDVIDGGNGADVIYGDGYESSSSFDSKGMEAFVPGDDLLVGGNGPDKFTYLRRTDSEYIAGAPGSFAGKDDIWGNSTTEKWDYIKDFRSGLDKIDFSHLARNVGAPDGTFNWFSQTTTDLGAVTSGGTASQRAWAVWQDTSKTFIYVDTTGDGLADMKIQVSNIGRGDFIGVDNNNGLETQDDNNDNDPVIEQGFDGAGPRSDSSATGNVLLNDTHANGDPLTIVGGRVGGEYDSGSYSVVGAIIVGTYGSLVLQTDGTWIYTLNDSDPDTNALAFDQLAYDIFTYNATDGQGEYETETLSIKIKGSNDGPVAVADTNDVFEDASVSGSVASNDSDPDVGAVLTYALVGPPVTGLIFNSDGSYVFNAAQSNVQSVGLDQTISIVVNYTVTDQYGKSDAESLTITVKGTGKDNVTAVTAGTFGAGAEDQVVAITGTLVAMDIDGLADGTVFSVTGAASNGTASIDPATGAWSYTPAADYNGPDSFTVTITDDAGNTTPQVITVDVATVVDIVGDTATTDEDTAVTTNVLDNDSFGGAPDVTSVTRAANGTVVIGVGGNVTYTPHANFNGSDSYTYTVTSGGVIETATVEVTVTPMNDAPVALDDGPLTTDEDTDLGNINVLGNDSDIEDGTPLPGTVTSASAANGIVTINDDGTLKYTPNANYNGPDTISYTVTDSGGRTDMANVSISVTPVNELSEIGDHNEDAESVAENAAIGTVVGFTAFADDPDLGDSVTYSLLDDADGRFAIDAISGVVTVANGSLDYEAFKSHKIKIVATDGEIDRWALVTIAIEDVNAAPILAPIANAMVAENSTGLVLTASATDDGEDTSTLTYSLSGDDAEEFVISATGVLTFLNSPDFEVPADFNLDNIYNVTVEVYDGLLSDVQQVTVNVTDVNEAPTVTLGNRLASTPENGADVKVADISVTDDGLGTNMFGLSGADAGAFSIIGNELYFNGSANFEVKASYDVTVEVSDATVGGSPDDSELLMLTITDVNEQPNAGADQMVDIAENQEAGTTVATVVAVDPDLGAGNDLDNAFENVSYAITTGNESNLFTIDPGTGVITTTGTLNHEATAQYVLEVSATDGGLLSDVQQVKVEVTDVNEAPSGADKTIVIAEDSFHEFTVSDFGFSDVDGNALLKVKIVTVPVQGFLTLGLIAVMPNDDIAAADIGNLKYTPPLDANGNGYSSFTFLVVDDGAEANGGVNEDTAPNTLTVDVTPVNDAPDARDDDDTLFTEEDSDIVNIVVLLNDRDVEDGTPLPGMVTSAIAANGWVMINSDGTLIYTPNPNYNGFDTITYTVTDSGGLTDTATVALLIHPISDAPVASIVDLGNTPENTPSVTITAVQLLAGVTDVDTPADGLTITVVSINTGAGNLFENDNGTWTYVPEADDDTNVIFNFEVWDGDISTPSPTTSTAILDLTPIDDASEGADKAVLLDDDTVPGNSVVDFWVF